MPLIFRVMTIDGDGPLIADTARGLGVRVGGGPNTDIPVTSAGDVAPATGGMSVGPSWRDLPLHRIPRRLRKEAPSAAGNDKDACWRMGEGPFAKDVIAEGLVLNVDRPTHGSVEPSGVMSLASYRSHLAATRAQWTRDES